MIDAIRERSRPWLRGLRGLLKNRLFLVTTFIPTALSIVYFGLIASDVYVSESRYVVRSPERQAASPLGLMLKGAGFSRAQDDSYAVQDFILSRDALQALDMELGVKKAFSDPSVDRLSRFAGLDWDDSFEALFPYYLRKVSVQLDSASSIATLSTRAFTAEQTFAINRRLLELAEELVNKLNERGGQDLIRFASKEVVEAQGKAKTAALALARFRNEKGVIDPEKQSTIPLQQIAKLQDELISTRSQIAQLERLAKDNSQLPVLRQRAKMLEGEIVAETSRVAGGGDRSLAGKAAEFQRLALEKEFADKMLASAMSTLEQARNEVQRKQLYLERIVQPSKPDVAIEPRRIRTVFIVIVCGLLMWGILALLVSGVREHRA
jgi:capsular polysaccharide transport system permease protein